MKPIFISTLLTLNFYVLAEHSEEPEYGYYDAWGTVEVSYTSSKSVYWYLPRFYADFTLPEENTEGPNIELTVSGSCYVLPHTGQVLGTFLTFTLDSGYDDTDRYVDDEITVRLKERIYNHTLDGYDEDNRLRWFTLKWVPTNGDVGLNYVNHENTIKYLLEDLMTEGRATVEAKDENGNLFKFILVSRPTGHQTHNLFDWVARCMYSNTHLDVHEEEQSLNSVNTNSFLNAYYDKIHQHRIKEFGPLYKSLTTVTEEVE